MGSIAERVGWEYPLQVEMKSRRRAQRRVKDDISILVYTFLQFWRNLLGRELRVIRSSWRLVNQQDMRVKHPADLSSSFSIFGLGKGLSAGRFSYVGQNAG